MKQRVLEYLSTVPAGKVVTYGAIAAAVGRPGAARAVGNILHRNPDPTRYPCHRVVSASGKLARISLSAARRASGRNWRPRAWRLQTARWIWKNTAECILTAQRP